MQFTLGYLSALSGHIYYYLRSPAQANPAPCLRHLLPCSTEAFLSKECERKTSTETLGTSARLTSTSRQTGVFSGDAQRKLVELHPLRPTAGFSTSRSQKPPKVPLGLPLERQQGPKSSDIFLQSPRPPRSFPAARNLALTAPSLGISRCLLLSSLSRELLCWQLLTFVQFLLLALK